MSLSAAEWSVIWLSLKVATWSGVVLLLPGVALGWLLARREFPGKVLVDAVVHLPLVLPPVVVGYLLLLVFGRSGPVGSVLAERGFAVAFAFPGAVLAAAVVALPLMVRAVRLAIELVDPGLEEAAATLGAGPWRRFATITLPLAAPGVLTGTLLAFARSLGEFGATITLAGNIEGVTRTLSIAIFTAIQVPGGDAAALRLSLAAILLSLVAVGLSEWLARRVQRQRSGRRT